MRNPISKALAILGIITAVSGQTAVAQAYKVTNLISDGSVPAAVTDANFINPWAVSSSGTWWMSAEGTGYNYVVTSATGAINFKVIIPNASGLPTATGLPAGSVTTGGAVGMLLSNATKASFLFSTLDGTIAGWNSKLGTANAVTLVPINNSAAGASYPGLAILNIVSGGVTSASYILAPNFGTGNKIEVYDSSFQPTHLAGSFTDPNLPTGYSPFSVHVLNGQIFVAYAQRTASAPYLPVGGPGAGVVDAFDLSGNFVTRVVTGGNLNAPWGVAFAPASFGIFSNDLLIGNFGDGIINVYDPKTFAYLGQLMDATGKALAYASLWELLPGGTTVLGTTAVSGGDPTTVYFTAGLAAEKHGLFANIASTTTAGSASTFGFSTSASAISVTAGSSAQATISVAPANGFAGTVTMKCTGLPIGATCSFSPASLTVVATAPSTATLTIQTTKTTGALQPFLLQHGSTGVVAAMLLPFAGLLAMRRRRSLSRAVRSLHLLGVLAITLAAGSLVMGCSDNSTFSPPGTPAGTSNVVVTATSGSVTQQSTIALTVK
jgi:uncharacterized protein (TIGR03118 family)